MTDSDTRTEEWKAVPGCSAYEASRLSVWERGADDRAVLVSGGIRSVDRIDKIGRRRQGRPLSTRLWGHYVMVDLRTDDGEKVTRTAHSVILETFAGPCPPGQESRHYDDNKLNCRWEPGATEEESRAAGGNLFYGTPSQNRYDGWRNNLYVPPPKPVKKVRLCNCRMRCHVHAPGECGNECGNGRCHACVVRTGVDAGLLLGLGFSEAQVAAMLGYPNVEGLVKLARKYGGRWWRVKRRLVTPRDGDSR